MNNDLKKITKEEFREKYRDLSPFELYQLVYNTRKILLYNESVLSNLEDEVNKEARNYYASPILEAIKAFFRDNGLTELITFDNSIFSLSFILYDVQISVAIVVLLQEEKLNFDWVLQYHTTKGVSRASINKLRKLFDEKLQAPNIIKGKLPSGPMGPACEKFTLCRFSSQEDILCKIKKNLVALLK